MKQTLGFRFSVLSRAIRRELDRILQQRDLTGVQFMVLAILHDLEEQKVPEINQKMLEERAHVTHPTMTEILKKLEKKEYILCRASEKDRRAKCIFSTEKAADLITAMDRVEEEVQEGILRGLTEEQIRMLDETTAMMIGNVCQCKRSEEKQ